MKLEIIVNLWISIGDQLKANVIPMPHKNEVIFITIAFRNFRNFDCHLFFKELLIERMIK